MRFRQVAALLSFVGIGIAAQSDTLASRSKGAPGAPIVVYEMADFQCPACRVFALETMPIIEREYIRTGKVRWVFVNFPLTSLHRNAVAAAEVAMCAGRQGKFWEMHDALFLRQERWAELGEPGPYLIALAESVGVARAALVRCAQTKATRRDVEDDAQRAVAAGARSTPTFHIEGGLLVGAAPAGVFRRILDSLGRDKTTGSP